MENSPPPNLETLIKQVSMLQSYIAAKHGNEFQDFCKQWKESNTEGDQEQGHGAQNNGFFTASFNSGRNIETKDEDDDPMNVITDEVDNQSYQYRLNILGLNSANQSPTGTKSQKKKRKKVKEKKNLATNLKAKQPNLTPKTKTELENSSRHREHGVSYFISHQGKEQLLYKDYAYHLDRDKGRRYWSCAAKKRKHGACKAQLVQAPDGCVISEETHSHPTPELVRTRKTKVWYAINKKVNSDIKKPETEYPEDGSGSEFKLRDGLEEQKVETVIKTESRETVVKTEPSQTTIKIEPLDNIIKTEPME